MKRIATKLTSRKGETLVEILVAVLIVALAAGMFASLYSASMNINLTARNEDEAFYKAVGDLENKIGTNEGDEKKKGLHYVPMNGGKEIEDSTKYQDIDVNVVTEDGLNIYNDVKSSGTSGGTSGAGGSGGGN